LVDAQLGCRLEMELLVAVVLEVALDLDQLVGVHRYYLMAVEDQ
jgi:hypothetical protein